MLDLPCHGCTKREVGCHGKCADYAAFNEKNVSQRKSANSERYKESKARSFLEDSFHARQRRH